MMALVLLGLPALFVVAVLQPSRRRMEAHKVRLDAIALRLQELPNVQALSAAELNVLKDPQARWRTRIPLLQGDAQRFIHYHRVVTGLQAGWKQDRVPLRQLRTSWDALKGSYSVPGDLGDPGLGLPQELTAPGGQLQAWVLDATIAGTPDRLFQAMETLVRVDPMLEPVGLRWETQPGLTRQSLLLRNLILVP